MSKYGTIPAPSSSSAPTPEVSSTAPALDFTCRANVPGSCAAAGISCCRPWREFAHPSALSVPGSFTDAYHRARANLSHFANNYTFVFLVVLSVSLLLLWRFRQLSIVLPCFFFTRAKVFPVLIALILLLLTQVGATASVLVSLLAVGIFLVLPHAVLHLPVDYRVDDEEEVLGSMTTEPPSTN